VKPFCTAQANPKKMKTAEEVEKVCKKLKPILGRKAEKLWYMYLAEDEKGRKDLALDIEIMAEKMLKKHALEGQVILLEPPSINDSSGLFLVGDVIYNNQSLHQLFLRPKDMIKQVGIFAVTGEGKTNLAFLLALQLLKSKIPFLVIDWKRSWRNLLSLQDQFPELKDVQVYTVGRDIAPFLWNPFRPPPQASRELWVSTIAEVLEKSHISGPGVAYYFSRIYSKFYSKFRDENFCPNFIDGLTELEGMRAYERELKWKQTALRIFHSFTLGPASKVFNQRNPIRLEDLLGKPVILELDLEMPRPLRIFSAEIILRWIHLYRLSHGETDQLRHVLFLEEVHNLFPKTKMEKETSNSLENIYREIRAFGQGLISITQHPSLLPIYLLGNCHTQIYLGLQHEDDIKTARKALFLDWREEPYTNLLKVGECIIKSKNRFDPCLVRIPFVPIKKGGIIDDDLSKRNLPFLQPEKAEIIQKDRFYPRDKYGRDQGSKNGTDQQNPLLHKLLIDIHKFPFSSIIQRYKRLQTNPKYGNYFKNLLISKDLAQPKNIVIKKSNWIILFELTPKGKAVLKDLGYDLKDEREGIEHKFWKHKIAEYYKNKGYGVLVQERANGEPDLIVMNGNKKAAIEIETGNSDAVHNIEKALKAGFDAVISVATNRWAEDKIRAALARNYLDKDQRVKLIPASGFDTN
jgi:hypothetical protein